jgi:hypothetical protein
MKFLCLAYYDEKKFGALSKAEVDALVSRCAHHDEELRATGRVTVVASLDAPRAATALRPRNGKPLVTDGPYAETKEQLGSFFLIDAADRAEAIRIASKHPAANLGEAVGWGIEVRAIETFVECERVVDGATLRSSYK